ncbi:MAG: hypothetical protein ABIO70_27540 [Pseudomonadota bacterium]
MADGWTYSDVLYYGVRGGWTTAEGYPGQVRSSSHDMGSMLEQAGIRLVVNAR